MSTVLEEWCTWFAVKKLSLNISKLIYYNMLFGNLNARMDITINGINIDRGHVTKFLGVLIAKKLIWKDHNSKC